MPNWPISSSEAAAFLASLSLLAQLGGTRLGEGADQVDDLVARHADAVVADGQRARVLVHLDLDVQIGGVDVQVLVPQRFQPQLVQRIGGVRDQLPQERVLVGVDRVDHQVQQLAGLGLELQLLDVCSHVDSVRQHASITNTRKDGTERVLGLAHAITRGNSRFVRAA